MKTVLITGGIGSGKSEVRKYLVSKGFPTYDCDSRCKSLYDEVPGLKSRIEETLGVPFSEIAVIFENDAARKALESIVFPLLHSDIRKWKDSHAGERIGFIESATATSHRIFDDCYDEVWLLEVPLSLRTIRNAKAALRAPLQSFAAAEADATIANDGSIKELHNKIDNLIRKI